MVIDARYLAERCGSRRESAGALSTWRVRVGDQELQIRALTCGQAQQFARAAVESGVFCFRRDAEIGRPFPLR